MVEILDLWLPILLSAVGVFIVSSLVHMVLGIHKSDYGKLAGEEEILEVMRKHGVNPGTYMFPHCGSMKDLGNEDVIAKFKQGPVGHATVLPSGPPAMGKNLLQWFIFSLIVGVFCAYVAGLSLGAGAEYLKVFQITGAVAFLGYGVSAMLDSVWKGARWSVTVKFIFDGLLYALMTAGVFGWLWPAA